ncbi:reductive dehalogenase anchoring protein [Dehalococcoides mccartyi VS]|uniref:Reductive dehalogenase anchoring protein n=1 Tax=Dehalococcoides mccartyi (strain VS) TaxID=311424 RepID=D2BJD8_DEHMV|nr:reductive dehalogenase anchoring protein [Dehalococcoides mccartyi VS]
MTGGKKVVSVLSPLWLAVGFMLGIGATVLFNNLRSSKLTLCWYEWVLGVSGLILLLAAIQHFAGAMVIEKYNSAAWWGLPFLGLPALVLLALTWQLVTRRIKKFNT